MSYTSSSSDKENQFIVPAPLVCPLKKRDYEDSIRSTSPAVAIAGAAAAASGHHELMLSSPLKKRAVRLTLDLDLDLEQEEEHTDTPRDALLLPVDDGSVAAGVANLGGTPFRTPQRNRKFKSNANTCNNGMPTPIPYNTNSSKGSYTSSNNSCSINMLLSSSPFRWAATSNANTPGGGGDVNDSMGHHVVGSSSSAGVGCVDNIGVFGSFEFSDADEAAITLQAITGKTSSSSIAFEHGNENRNENDASLVHRMKDYKPGKDNEKNDNDVMSPMHGGENVKAEATSSVKAAAQESCEFMASTSALSPVSFQLTPLRHPAIFGSVLMGEALKGINCKLRASPVTSDIIGSSSNAANGSMKTMSGNVNVSTPNLVITKETSRNFHTPDAAMSTATSGLLMTPLVVPNGSSNGNNKNSNITSKQICNCTKSQCLKLYCQCFAQMAFCSTTCNCQDCCNLDLEMFRKQRQQAIASAKSKNSNAFGQNGGDRVGCKCKKSGCLKRYCECYQAGQLCGDKCKCVSCQNYSGSAALQDQQRRRSVRNSRNNSSSVNDKGEVTATPTTLPPLSTVTSSSTKNKNSGFSANSSTAPGTNSSASIGISNTVPASAMMSNSRARSNAHRAPTRSGSYPTPPSSMMMHHPNVHSNSMGYHHFPYPPHNGHNAHATNAPPGIAPPAPYNMLAAAWMAATAAAAVNAARVNSTPSSNNHRAPVPGYTISGGTTPTCWPMMPQHPTAVNRQITKIPPSSTSAKKAQLQSTNKSSSSSVFKSNTTTNNTSTSTSTTKPHPISTSTNSKNHRTKNNEVNGNVADVSFQITSNTLLPPKAAHALQSYMSNEDLLNASIVCKQWYTYQEQALWR